MRRNCLRSLGLLALLAVSAGIAAPRLAQSKVIQPNCFLSYQECDACGWDLQKLCSVYDCDDGTQRVSCGSCSPFCTVP